jgi:hypothetical protein
MSLGNLRHSQRTLVDKSPCTLLEKKFYYAKGENDMVYFDNLIEDAKSNIEGALEQDLLTGELSIVPTLNIRAGETHEVSSTTNTISSSSLED